MTEQRTETQTVDANSVEGLLSRIQATIEGERAKAADLERRLAEEKSRADANEWVCGLIAKAAAALDGLNAWQDAAEAQKALGAKEAELSYLKGANLREVKEQYELAVTEATMTAYAEGAVDGKNQSQRDVELAAYLAKCEAIGAAKAQLNSVEAYLARCEGERAVLEGEVKTALNRYHAARAAADLHTAMLRAVAGM